MALAGIFNYGALKLFFFGMCIP